MVLKKTLESPLDCKETQPVHPKGNQSWIFIGRTDVEAETPILWPPDVKNWFLGKDPDAGKDWRREEKGMTEDEMVGWMASLTQWTWVSVNSGSWWWTGRPDMLQSMESQRVGHDWRTELKQKKKKKNSTPIQRQKDEWEDPGDNIEDTPHLKGLFSFHSALTLKEFMPNTDLLLFQEKAEMCLLSYNSM